MADLWCSRRVRVSLSRLLLVSLFLSLVPFSAISTPTEDAAAQPAAGAVYACAGLFNGIVRSVANPSQCTAAELPVNLNGETPVTLCAHTFTTLLRHPFGKPCNSAERPVVLPGERATTLCVSLATKRLRAPANGQCPPGEGVVTVPQANDPPVAQDDSFTTAEDTPLNGNVLADNGNGVDSDPDGDPLTVNPTPVSGPNNGNLTLNADGSFTYTPDPDFNGSDSFVYMVSDGEGGSDTAMVTITITAINDAPVAQDDSFTTAEDTPLNGNVLADNGSGPDSDPDGDALTVTSYTAPTNGNLSSSLPSGAFTYTPNADFFGADTFTYNVCDPTPLCATGTVTINVTALDDPPTAVDDSATVDEDSGANAIDVLANDSDVDGGPISISSVTQPTNGTVVITGGGTGLTYQPDIDYCNAPPGTTLDSFTYTLTPGGSAATVMVTVNCLDDNPVALDDTATVAEDSGANAIAVLANDTDADGGPISISSVTQPANGTVVITGGGTGLTYQPNPNYCNNPPGTLLDTFTYTLAPGGSTATVSVTVNCFDDDPTAVADAATVAEDSGANAIDVLANDTDPDGGSISIASVTQPANGSVVITNAGADLTYTPNADYCNDGSPVDTFSYTLTPGGSTANVSVTVTCSDDAPTAVDDAATVNEDSGANTLDVLANDNDIDAGPISITSVTQPTNGTVVITNAGADLSYAPNAEYCNNPPGTTPDSFTYTLAPGGAVGTVSVTVTCVDDDPAAVDDAATVVEDSGATALSVLTNDTDIDGGPLSIQSVTQPANGAVIITGGGTGLTYQPNDNYCNDPPGTTPDTFTYTLNGGSTATVTITVTCLDDNPVAVADAATVVEDSSANAIDALANDTDVDGGPISITSITQPVNGAAAITGGGTGLSYTPNPNYCNDPPGTTPDTFTYTLTPGGSSTTVSVTVTCVDDPPVAVDDAATVLEDAVATAVNVLANDTDIDGGPLSIQSVTQPTNGAVVITGGGAGLTYQPNPNYCNDGSPLDTFTYTLTPGGSTATVSMTVTCVNDPPLAGADSFDFIGNTELRVDLAAGGTPAALETTGSTFGVLDNDSEPEGDNFAITALTVGACTDNTAPFDCTDAGVGTVHMEANGRFSFIPAPGDTDVTESFTYTVTDDGLPAPASAVGTVTLTRFDRVWYVDPTAGGGGNGTSATPFNTLTPLSGAGGAGDVDVPGDYLFVHAGTLAMTTPLPLEASQYLWGQGIGLSLPVNLNGNGSPTNLVVAGAQPQLTNATGDAVTVGTAIPIELRGLSLASTTGNAIDLTTAAALSGSATLLIANNEFRGAGTEGVDVNLNASTTGTLTLTMQTNTWNGAGTHTGNAVDVNRAAGTLNLAFSANTGIVSSGTAVNIAGGVAASTTMTAFSGNTISGNTGGAGVVVSNVTFDATPGGAVQQVNGGVLPIGASGNPVGGAGMQLTTVQGNLLFSDLDIFAATSGLLVTGPGMTFAAASTSTIDADNGAAVDVTNVALNLVLADLESVTSGAGVNLNTVSGAFSAPAGSTISKTSGGGTGFVMASSSATVTYGGLINVTAGSGVALTNNTGTVSFTGQLTLNTGANPAFAATGGGTVVVTGGPNTLVTTTATALNVANTTIDAGGLTFQSINSNGGANSGIILNTTGVLGGLTVTGVSSAGSGGTIQNKTGVGVMLSSTSNVNLSWMIVQDGQDDGIRGTSVTGFSLANSTISGNGTEVTERGIEITGLFGTASVTNSTVTASAEDNLYVLNSSSPALSLSVSGSTFSATSAAVGNDGIHFLGNGSADMTLSVSGSSFSNNRGDHIQVVTDASSAATIRATISGNTLTGSAANLGASITIDTGGTSNTRALVANNNIQGAISSAITFNTVQSATMHATATGNIVGMAGVTDSGSVQGDGINAAANDASSITLLIDANQIRQYSNLAGINVHARDGSAFINATITNNLIANPGTFASNGVLFQAGSVAGDNGTSCLALTGNTTAGSGANGGTDIRVRQRILTTVRMPGYGGVNNDTAAVNSFVAGNNPGSESVSSTENTGAGGGGFGGGAACTLPQSP